MTSSVRIVTAIASLALMGGLTAGLTSCGRGAGSTHGDTATANVARANLDDAAKYQVTCEKFCDEHLKAATLAALCSAVEARSTVTLGAKATCNARKPFGALVDGSLAVKDAAILDVATAQPKTTYALLALQTETGWLLARELGSVTAGGTLQVVASRPVDIAGLEPAAFQIRVSLSAPHGGSDTTSERLFACGLNGEGAVKCPLALTVARRDDVQPLSAGVAGAIARKDAGWMVDVDLTPQGYVASSVQGVAPTGLVGEHGWTLQ